MAWSVGTIIPNNSISSLLGIYALALEMFTYFR